MSVDDQILSEYVDGEVPSPWNEEVARRVADDPKTRAAFERLSTVHRRLRAVVDHSETCLDLPAAGDRVWQRLSVSMAHRRPLSPWRRPVYVPVFGVAAAATLLLGFGMVALVAVSRLAAPVYDLATDHNLRSPTAAAAPSLRTVGAEQPPTGLRGDVEVTIAVQDIEQLLQILGAGTGLQEVRIELPPQTQFQLIGEPQLLRAADVVRESEE